MGNDTSPDNLRGFLTPWPMTINNVWDAESTYTVNSPLPDVPEPGGEYDLGLTSQGTFTATEPINIKTQKAGAIGDGSFVWKSESDTDYYGRDSANIITSWQIVEPGTSTAGLFNNVLDCLSLPNGYQILLVERETHLAGQIIRAYVRDENNNITQSDLYSQTGLTTQNLYGGLCTLSDGSILAAYLIYDTTSLTAQIQTARSYNGGANWFVVSTHTLETGIDISGTFGPGVEGFDITNISLAEAQGQIALFITCLAHNESLSSINQIKQYVSVDNGCNFLDVGTTGGAQQFYGLNVQSKDGVFYLLYIDSLDSAVLQVLENATIPLDSLLGFGTGTQILTGYSIAINQTSTGASPKSYLGGNAIPSFWIDEAGRFFAVFKDCATEKGLFLMQSSNSFDWNFSNYSGNAHKEKNAQIFFQDSTTTMITRHVGCSARGTHVLFHNFVASSAPLNIGAVHLFELGGWSNVNMPPLLEYPKFYQFGGNVRNWVAYNNPTETGWTKQGTGTITAGAYYSTFNSVTLADFVRVFLAPVMPGTGAAPTLAEGAIVRTKCRSVTGGADTTGRGVAISNHNCTAAVIINTNKLTLFDEIASTAIATATISTTAGIEILLSVRSNNARAWYRSVNLMPGQTDTTTAKKWIYLGGGVLNNTGAIGSTVIQFGHLNSTGATMETHWHETQTIAGPYTGIGLQGFSNPESLIGRLYPPKGTSVYVNNGVQISTFDGPGYEGEFYTIKETSMFPFYRVFTGASRSPRVGWRSSIQAQNQDQNIALYWNPTIGDAEQTITNTDSFGVAMFNVNFRQFEIEVKQGPVWNSAGTFTNDIGGGLTFTRTGTSITISGSSGIFIHENECIGYTCLFGTGPTAKARKVKSNSAGNLGIGGTSNKRAVLQLEDVELSDPGTGTMYLIPNSFVAIVHSLGLYSQAIKIKISAQVTPDQYFKIGSVVVGNLIVPQQYGRGRTISFEGGTQSEITQDGVERVRRTHQGGRTIRLSWSEGIDTSQLYQSSASPDYYTLSTAAGAKPLGVPNATPSTMAGIARFCNGNEKPLVYIPKITRSAATTEILNRRQNHILTTIQGEVSEESVLGNELSGDNLDGEVFRVGTMILRELF